MKPPRSLATALVALAALAFTGRAPLLAQEAPVAAGSEGVPVPKKTKHVQPIYPQEALAQGVRGIVILDLVLDAQGKVEATTVIRSVPGLDEAAIAAARQWEYEPTKVDGKPARVRLTVPITFALAAAAAPARSPGVPDLRQGVNPAWPAGASGGGRVAAEVTLEPDGRVGVARVLEGDAPWAGSLLAALRTWRFAPPPEDEVLSFRVEADFVAARGSDPARVDLKATGLQRSDLLGEPAPASGSAPASATATPAPATPAPATPAPATPAPAAPAPATPAPATPAPATPAPATPAPAAPAPTTPARRHTGARHPAPATRRPPPGAATRPRRRPHRPRARHHRRSRRAPCRRRPRRGRTPAAPPQAGAAPPVEEVITAPPPALPAENGVSAIRDVTLEPGVPDLARGRRPVTPPLARMTAATGKVEVTFSVGASGATAIQTTVGPELLQARGRADGCVLDLPSYARGPGLPDRGLRLHGGQGVGGRAPARRAGGGGHGRPEVKRGGRQAAPVPDPMPA